MKAVGIWNIKGWDIETGLPTKNITKTNQVTEYLYEYLLFKKNTVSFGRFHDTDLFSTGNRILLSDFAGSTQRGLFLTRGDIPNIVGTGSNGSWTYNLAVKPAFAEFVSRVDAPGGSTTISFSTLAIALSSSTGTGNPIFAYVTGVQDDDCPDGQTCPCTQSPTEVLDIVYRIQIDWTDNGTGRYLPPDHEEYFVKNVWFGPSNNSEPSKTYGILFPNPSANYLYLFPGEVSLDQDNYRSDYWSNSTTYFYKRFYRDYTKDEYVGAIINTVGIGNYKFNGKNAISYVQTFDPVGLTLSQGIYGHTSTAPGPFEDLNTQATGTGNLVMSGSWTGSFPVIYQVQIQQTGNVGTATYNLRKRTHFGFNGNTWISRNEVVPFLNHTTPSFEGFHGWDNNNYIRVSNNKIASWDSTGVVIIDLYNGDYQIFDINNNALNVTNINQVSADGYIEDIYEGVDSSFLYVACKDTGLWRINVSSSLVTQLSPNPCYGVDVGHTGKIYAVFGDRISDSDNFTIAKTFTYSGFDFTTVEFIKVDRNSVNNDLAIVYGTNSLLWWSEALTAGADGPTGLTLNSQLELAPAWYGVIKDSVDRGAIYKLTFGGDTTTRVGDSSSYSPNPIVIGDKVFMQFENSPSSSNASALYDSAGTELSTFTAIEGTDIDAYTKYAVYLGNSVYLYGALERSSILTGLFDNTSYAWAEYGWDGSQWVLGSTGTKTTHSTAEPLLDGISIAFADGTTGTAFISSENYTQVYCHGLMKDNATLFSWEHYFHIRRSIWDATLTVTLPSSSPYEITVPAVSSDPDFYYLYAFTDEYHSFQLDGVEVAAILTEDSPLSPVANEVKIYKDGKIEFNSADAGKTLTGTYAYMKY